MRYIGNKTKLLPFIGELLGERGVPRGRSLDAFAGTAAVGSFLKARGGTVVGCDLMTFSYVLQRAYVVADSYPAFAGLTTDRDVTAARRHRDFGARVEQRIARRDADTAGVSAPTVAASGPTAATRPLDEILVYLDSYLDPLTSFISRHFAASQEHDQDPARVATLRPPRYRASTVADPGDRLPERGGSASAIGTPPAPPRMYFTLDGARRIDAIRHRLHEWRHAGAISDDEYYVLLAALLEGADAIANTTGIYAAYMKQWQPNALRDLQLRLPPLVTRAGARAHDRCEAHQGDVSVLAPRLGHFDLLYIDPPYNTRQYSAYYHIPELIARGWFDEAPVLRGKTGLFADADKKSAWSARARCVAALEDLLSTVDANHVVLSYNSEGIIPDEDIERIFRSVGRAGTFARVAREYQRYRSDSPSATRRYKARSVTEQLYYVRRG